MDQNEMTSWRDQYHIRSIIRHCINFFMYEKKYMYYSHEIKFQFRKTPISQQNKPSIRQKLICRNSVRQTSEHTDDTKVKSTINLHVRTRYIN